MDRRAIGTAAEAAARDYLLAQGVRIIGENFRCRAGELDLIATEGDTLAIVEVRMRSSARFGGAAASVGPRKQMRIIRATRYLLLMKPELNRLAVRFDVITLDGVSSANPTVQWLRGAFEARG